MERHLQNIRFQTSENTEAAESGFIDADKEPEKAREFFKECIKHDKEVDILNLRFIEGFEKDLEEYDRMLLDETNSLLEARKLERLITGRLKVLVKAKPDKDDNIFERHEMAIYYAKKILEELDCKKYNIENQPKQHVVKIFTDYLQNVNKDKLMILLKSIFVEPNTKDIARYIIALKESLYIDIPNPKTKLWEAMRVEFGYFGSNEAINIYLREKITPKGTDTKILYSEIEETRKLIEKHLNN